MDAFLRGIVAKLHRLRPESIGNGHAYSATGVIDASHDTTCSPVPPNQKTTMKNDNYAALVALDWGDKNHAFAWQFADAQSIERGTIEATPEALHAWLDQLHATCKGRPVALAVESGRNTLLHALLEHEGLRIYPVHSATSARFRKTFTPSGAKDDGPDALMLLTLLRTHRDQLKPLMVDTPVLRELAALVAIRRSAVDQRTRTLNQLTSLLKTYYPQALVLAGEDLATPLARAFLRRFPELLCVQKARAQTMRVFYQAHNVRSLERIQERMTVIAQARALIADRALIEPAILEMTMLVDLLEVQTDHIAKLQTRIGEVFQTHPQASLFSALPGAGATLAPRLLVAFGDNLERYPSAASLQKYSGIAPVREKSGGRSWTHWRWAAPKFLRQSFVEWAGQTVRYSAWAQAYYCLQKQRGKAHHAILRALAFKWIRILWRCSHDQIPYNENHYLAALQAKASPLHNALQK